MYLNAANELKHSMVPLKRECTLMSDVD